MDDVKDLDAGTEAEGRQLLTAAFETAPVGEVLAGDLLRGVRRRTTRRRRVRALVPAGAVTVTAGAVTAATLLTASVVDAPSAFAAMTAAAAKTSAESFRVTATETIRFSSPIVPLSRGGVVHSTKLIRQRASGEFDPRRGLGDERTVADGTPTTRAEIRFVGGHEYASIPPAPRLFHGKPWVETRVTRSLLAPDQFHGVFVNGFNGDQPIDPGALLGLLKSAASVRDEGPASGPGWTGTKYAFTARATTGAIGTVTGTVYVDDQGRVRRLMTTFTWPADWAYAKGKVSVENEATTTDDVTFGGFGVHVTVAAPPSSQVDNLGNKPFGSLFP
jgi:hypothetical protein